MTKFLTLVGVTYLLFSCSAKPTIDKTLVYSTLSEIIQQDTIFARVICSKFARSRIPSNIKFQYFNGDESFIQEQYKNSINISVDTGKIFFYWRKKKGLEKSHIDTTCSDGIFYRLTYPIFSKDLNTVIVGVTEGCNPTFLCGWGWTAVYKRQNGKWVKVTKFDEWIS